MIEALARRPAVEGAGGGGLPVGRQMPFAKRARRITEGAEHLGEGLRVVAQDALLAPVIRGGVQDGADSDRVRIAAGQQRGAGRRADAGRVEAVVTEAIPREAFEGRCRDRSTEGLRGAESDVVEEYDDDVGRVREDGAERRVRARLACGELETSSAEEKQ